MQDKFWRTWQGLLKSYDVFKGAVKMDEKVMEMFAKILEGQKDIQNELKQEIREVSSKVDKLEMRMENEVSDKIKILFDVRQV